MLSVRQKRAVSAFLGKEIKQLGTGVVSDPLKLHISFLRKAREQAQNGCQNIHLLEGALQMAMTRHFKTDMEQKINAWIKAIKPKTKIN